MPSIPFSHFSSSTLLFAELSSHFICLFLSLLSPHPAAASIYRYGLLFSSMYLHRKTTSLHVCWRGREFKKNPKIAVCRCSSLYVYSQSPTNWKHDRKLNMLNRLSLKCLNFKLLPLLTNKIVLSAFTNYGTYTHLPETEPTISIENPAGWNILYNTSNLETDPHQYYKVRALY